MTAVLSVINVLQYTSLRLRICHSCRVLCKRRKLKMNADCFKVIMIVSLNNLTIYWNNYSRESNLSGTRSEWVHPYSVWWATQYNCRCSYRISTNATRNEKRISLNQFEIVKQQIKINKLKTGEFFGLCEIIIAFCTFLSSDVYCFSANGAPYWFLRILCLSWASNHQYDEMNSYVFSNAQP